MDSTFAWHRTNYVATQYHRDEILDLLNAAHNKAMKVSYKSLPLNFTPLWGNHSGIYYSAADIVFQLIQDTCGFKSEQYKQELADTIAEVDSIGETTTGTIPQERALNNDKFYVVVDDVLFGSGDTPQAALTDAQQWGVDGSLILEDLIDNRSALIFWGNVTRNEVTSRDVVLRDELLDVYIP